MSYDVKLTADGDLPFGNDFVSGDDLVLQTIGIQLAQGLGEWPLDVTTGIPYEQWIERGRAPLEAIEAKFTVELNSIEGVSSVDEINVTFDRDDLRVDVQATCNLDSGNQAVLVGALGSDSFDPLGRQWHVSLITDLSLTSI